MSLIEAQNPETSPERLVVLSRKRDVSIVEAVVANPNTPKQVLLKLGKRHPDALCKNPILFLLFLENPNFWMEIPEQTKIGMAKSEELADNLLLYLAEYGSMAVKTALCNRPNISEALYLKLKDSAPIHLQEALSLHKDLGAVLPVDWESHAETLLKIELLRSQSQHETLWNYIRRDFNANTHYSTSLLESITQHPNKYVRRMAISLRNLPASIQERFARDSDANNRMRLARNPDVTSEVLTILARDKVAMVRAAVVQNPRTSMKLIETMQDDKALEVRQALVRLPRISTAILTHLWNKYQSFDDMNMTIADIARHPNLLEPYLWKMFEHAQNQSISNYWIWEKMLENPNLPESILVAMLDALKNLSLRPPFVSIFDKIVAHPNLRPPFLPKIDEYDTPSYQIGFAANPNLPLEMFQELFKASNMSAAIYMANNPKAPASILVQLGEKNIRTVYRNPNYPLENISSFLEQKCKEACVPPNPDNLLFDDPRTDFVHILNNLSQHPHLPTSILEQIASYFDVEEIADRLKKEFGLMACLVKHPHSTRQIRLRFATYSSHELNALMMETEETKPIVLRRLAKSTIDFVRLYVLLHPESQSLADLSLYPTSDSWAERYVIAKHPKTPQSVLELLVNDTNIYVRAQAQKRYEPSVKVEDVSS